MKKCGGNLAAIAAVLLLAFAMFAGGIWFLIHLLAHPGEFSETEHQELFLGLLMLFAAAFFLTRNTLRSAAYKVEYDDFSLVFHLCNADERIFNWYELPKKVQLRHVAAGIEIHFLNDGKKLFLSNTTYGFRHFLRVLRKRGLVS